jgi:hypothetical protein
MPEALKQIVPAKKPERPRSAPVRPLPVHQSHDNRAFLFFVSDLAFLVLAGIAATLTMHLIHQLEWHFIPTCVIGMIAAMLVQMLMAFAVAPLLGSIESMVPSMIVAMVSPMTICVLHLFGCESTWVLAAAIGSVFAVITFTFIQFYARSCRDVLARQTELSQG